MYGFFALRGLFSDPLPDSPAQVVSLNPPDFLVAKFGRAAQSDCRSCGATTAIYGFDCDACVASIVVDGVVPEQTVPPVAPPLAPPAAPAAFTPRPTK